MNKQGLTLILATLTLSISSCRKEGCTDENALNYASEAKKEDGSCVYTKTLSVPNTYVFTRNGQSTVDFSGQKERLNMLHEISDYLKTANTAGVAVDAQVLKNMYANNNYSWTDSDGLGMTGSSKQLKNKTAYGIAGGSPDATVQAMFESYIDDIAAISSATVMSVESGEPGIAGVWPFDGVGGPYLMNGGGLEYVQLIEKGLMCAVFMNQMTVNYLAAIGNDNNTMLVDSAAGKLYTEMEHHWDEAYGYFTSAINFPQEGTDRFWGKYASGREAIIQSGTKIATAFRTGRTAIVNKDYALRDLQVNIITVEIERLSASTAIHYLNAAKTHITNATARNHYLSEAYAFTEGLKYGYRAIKGEGMTISDIQNAINIIGTDFNIITIADINNCIDLIATKTGLENVKSQL